MVEDRKASNESARSGADAHRFFDFVTSKSSYYSLVLKYCLYAARTKCIATTVGRTIYLRPAYPALRGIHVHR